jgi:pimeloyl-ACP methyl ester carboxylesterase
VPATRATTIDIPGYRGEPVPCVLHSAGGERGVGVVFPGAARDGNRLGGTPARPDLHYTRAVLRAEGLAVFEVWWDAGSAPEDALEEWLDANVGAALGAAARDHPLALLAGRSLGTMALARAVSDAEWKRHPVPTVWLAPLLRQRLVAQALSGLRSPAFIAGGDADRAFDVEAAERIRRGGGDVVVLEGANHALEVDDPAASARLLADLVERLRGFVARTTGTA